jgi:DNA-binding transcriptional regulator YhcF (GntR family)
VAKRDDERLASRRVANLLRAEIEQDRYPAGGKLPSYRQLAAEHGVAVNTAQAAVQLLATEGLVDVRAASGAYVRDRSATPPEAEHDSRAELAEILDRLHRAGKELETAEQAVVSLLQRLPSGDPTQ